MKITTFLATYDRGTLQITDDIKYDLRDVIERSNRLKHGKFENPNFPDGTKKLFYNIAFSVANTIYRNTDLDTKNMNVVSLNGVGASLMPLLKMALKWFLKVAGYSTIINDVRQEMIDMGHVVTKVVKGKAKTVNLLNLIVPPHVDSIQDSGCVEATFLTWDQVEKQKSFWQGAWEQVEAVKKANEATGEVYFTVYEHWTEDMFDGKYQKGCIKYLDMGVVMTHQKSSNQQQNWQPHEELERFAATDFITDQLTDEKVQVYPYKERRFIKIKGRWLGFGVYELLAGLQEDYNERMNMKRRLDRQALTGIMLHRLPSDVKKASMLTQQFLSSVDQGAVLDIEQDEDLTRLNAATIPDFIMMIDKIFEIMRVIIGVNSQGVGEDLPASMPATIGVINQRVAQTTYDVVIEEQSIFWTEMFNEFLLEDIINALTKKKVIAITGDASIIDDLDKYYTKHLLNSKIEEFQKAYGVPGIVYQGKQVFFDTSSPQTYEQQYNQTLDQLIKELQATGDARFTQIKKEMLKDIQFGVQFYVDSEAFDKRATVNDLMTFRQIPDLTLSKSKLDEYLLDLSAGLDSKRFQKSDAEKAAEIQAIKDRAQAEQMGATNMVQQEGGAQQTDRTATDNKLQIPGVAA